MGPGPGSDQRLRPNGDHGVCVDECAADSGFGRGADRRAGIDGGVVRPRRVVAAGPGRRGRRVVCGRPRCGCGLCRPDRVDRVAVCGVSVRGVWGADVSHRGSGVLACRWAAAVSGPRRRTSQDPRLPHRTRRNPNRVGRAGRGGSGGGHRPRRPPLRQTPGRLRYRGGGPGRGADRVG